MAAFFRMFKERWFTPPQPVSESYEGRNVIVTGATSGIGFEAVAKFAALGASTVIIAARDVKRGESAKAELESRLGRKDQLEVWQLDLSSFDSVMAFAKRAEGLAHIDIAILNAGVRRSRYAQSRHGWEEDLQVNTLSTTLLGILLLPKLKESKLSTGRTPVLEFVNSGLHRRAVVSPHVREEPNILEYYNRPESFGEGSQYKFTKLFLMFAANKLAEEVSSKDVIITSICPGPVRTDLGRDHYFPGVSILIFILGLLFLHSAERGANTILSGTTQGERAHGRFWKRYSTLSIQTSCADLFLYRQ